jgi:hypothetical protein
MEKGESQPDYEGFAKAILDNWPDGGSIDLWDLQDEAIHYGLLVATLQERPCGENCWCAEFHGVKPDGTFREPVTCYRRVWVG